MTSSVNTEDLAPIDFASLYSEPTEPQFAQPSLPTLVPISVNTPTLPALPSLPTLASISANIPTLPSLPTLASISVNTPATPTLPALPGITNLNFGNLPVLGKSQGTEASAFPSLPAMPTSTALPTLAPISVTTPTTPPRTPVRLNIRPSHPNVPPKDNVRSDELVRFEQALPNLIETMGTSPPVPTAEPVPTVLNIDVSDFYLTDPDETGTCYAVVPVMKSGAIAYLISWEDTLTDETTIEGLRESVQTFIGEMAQGYRDLIAVEPEVARSMGLTGEVFYPLP